MANLKKKIIKGLHEDVVDPENLEQGINDLVDTTKRELNVDDKEAKEFVSGIVVGVQEEGYDVDGAGVEYGINPEVGGDKYDEYRALMQQLADEEGEQPVKESIKGKMTKNQLIETVTGKKVRRVIKTIKVKDIK